MSHDSPTLILAIPGTQETQEVARDAVLEGIRNGEIAPDQWVWSPEHNDWKTVAEIPELQPTPEPEPAPAPVTTSTPTSAFMNGAVPALPSFPSAPAGAQPQKAQVSYVAQPVKTIQTPRLTDSQQLAATKFSRSMEVKHEFPIFKVLFFISFIAAAGILAANYFLVEQPFAANYATTSYGKIPAYAHLGAFTQPGALVIHVPPSSDINAGNFADLLTALAKSTPPQPLNSGPFSGVGLTASWQSQYVMNGTDWQNLAQMGKASADDRKKFILEHLVQIDGTPLVKVHRDEDPAALAAIEDKAWQPLVANFAKTQ